MRVGTVVGAVWGARHAAALDGAKLLRIRMSNQSETIACDRLGAGVGSRVLVAMGSRVRDLTLGPAFADKEVVLAILDGEDDAGDAA
jgi:microcompartment protein CcmK/EutM